MALSTLSDSLGKYNGVFTAIGVATVSYIALKLIYSLLRIFKIHFLAGPLGLGANLKKFGEWAVVTGSTDGIGKAYAQQLAKKGINIVLVSRSPDKLADVSQEIERDYKVKTKTIAVDFTEDYEMYDKVKTQLTGLDIGVLVNNVGMGYGYPEYMTDLPDGDKLCRDLVHCNILSVTMMTRLILPGMVEKRRGAVINISSGSGITPTPLLSVYGATKTYVDFFSRALQAEVSSKGVIVQSVMPYFVTTKLSKIRRSSVLVPSPKAYVASALATCGLTSRTFGCLSHEAQGWFYSAIPECIYSKLSIKILGIRRKAALKKMVQKKTE